MLKLLTELLTAVINRLITRLEIGAGFWPVMIYELDKNLHALELGNDTYY